MGIFDAIKTKVDEFDKAYNPMRKVSDAIAQAPTPAPTEAQTARNEAIARGRAAREAATPARDIPTELKVKPF
jgi:hypothetical protein